MNWTINPCHTSSHEPYPVFQQQREVHGQRVWIPRRRCDVPVSGGFAAHDNLWHSQRRTRQLKKNWISTRDSNSNSNKSNNKSNNNNNNNNNNNDASPISRLCSEAENEPMAPVRGEASAGTICIQLDALRPKPQNQNHVSNGVPTASWDHADQPSDGHGWSRWNRAPLGACEPTARRLVHCVVVGVTRTGNVPEATAHGKLVEQFAAPRHANAAHLASNATISTATPTATPTTAGNQVKTFHADPIQNEVTQNEVVSDAKRKTKWWRKKPKKRKKWKVLFFSQ